MIPQMTMPALFMTLEEFNTLKKETHCRDCKHTEPEYYVVLDKVWLEAWPTYLEDREAAPPSVFLFLCLDCLSKRLDRQLVIGDFDISAPVNSSLLYGYRMGLQNCVRGIKLEKDNPLTIREFCDQRDKETWKGTSTAFRNGAKCRVTGQESKYKMAGARGTL